MNISHGTVHQGFFHSPLEYSIAVSRKLKMEDIKNTITYMEFMQILHSLLYNRS